MIVVVAALAGLAACSDPFDRYFLFNETRVPVSGDFLFTARSPLLAVIGAPVTITAASPDNDVRLLDNTLGRGPCTRYDGTPAPTVPCLGVFVDDPGVPFSTSTNGTAPVYTSTAIECGEQVGNKTNVVWDFPELQPQEVRLGFSLHEACSYTADEVLVSSEAAELSAASARKVGTGALWWPEYWHRDAFPATTTQAMPVTVFVDLRGHTEWTAQHHLRISTDRPAEEVAVDVYASYSATEGWYHTGLDDEEDHVECERLPQATLTECHLVSRALPVSDEPPMYVLRLYSRVQMRFLVDVVAAQTLGDLRATESASATPSQSQTEAESASPELFEEKDGDTPQISVPLVVGSVLAVSLGAAALIYIGRRAHETAHARDNVLLDDRMATPPTFGVDVPLDDV